MTAERDLERQLATWFDERAVTAPPPDLLARSLARAARVGQRPAVLTRDRWTGGTWRLGALPLPAPALLLLLLLFASALIIAGSQLIQTRLPVIAPGPTSGPEATQAAPTLEPTLIATEAPGNPATATLFATLHDVAAFGDVAWVTTEAVIYRTEDAGATWRAVQPAGWTLPFSESFVDADTAYVPVGDGLTIAATHDGGRTWTSNTIDLGKNPTAPVLSASSPMDAMATYVDQAHFNKSDGTGLFVFTTSDGGTTWSGPAHGLQPNQQASMGKLEPANKEFLLDVPGKFPSKPFANYFDLSTDGGVNWTRYTFPISKISPKADQKGVGDVFMEPNGHFLAELGATPDGPGTFPVAIYESTDDAAVWRLLYTEPSPGDYGVQFLSPTTWIVRSGAPSAISTTTDVGATWQTVTPSMSLYDTGNKVFGSVSTGWTSLECRWLPTPNGCDRQQHSLFLFVTTDGGRTWSQVGT